ncbi:MULTISPECIES: ABC transporter ATP-binding protein [unclassified Luteococcus]|uniref:ABC transporter ATP-binding protein n=1 Tax=unclassified Luteococcus TaxID=2639923 RepID=UPI00313F1469
MSSTTPALLAQGITKTYLGGLRAVSGVDLAIERGQCLALVGQSGSGKSTLARCLLGVEPMDSGRVWLGDDELTALKGRPYRHRRARIQAVFQSATDSFNARLPLLTSVLEPLDCQPEVLRRRVAEAGGRRQLAEQLFERVELPTTLLDRMPGRVSGGQLQRAAIARALSIEPELIVLDEPTASLDVSLQARILNLLKDLQEDLQVSMLFITHDLAAARFVADQIVVMRHGQFIDEFPAQDLCAEQRDPYTRELVSLFS